MSTSSQMELLERLVVAVETIAGSPQQEEVTPERRRMLALAEMVACKGNLSKVARKIGCHRNTLQRDEILVQAFRTYNAGLSVSLGDPTRAESLSSIATYDQHDLE